MTDRNLFLKPKSNPTAFHAKPKSNPTASSAQRGPMPANDMTLTRAINTIKSTQWNGSETNLPVNVPELADATAESMEMC